MYHDIKCIFWKLKKNHTIIVNSVIDGMPTFI